MDSLATLENRFRKSSRNSLNTLKLKLETVKGELPFDGSKTAGQLMVIAQSASLTGSPVDEIGQIKRSHARKSKAARLHLKEAAANANRLFNIADSIERLAPPPADIDPVIAAQVRTAVAGAKAGIIDNHALAATIRDAANEASRKLAAIEKSGRKYDATAAIIVAKGTAAAYRKFSSDGLQKAAAALEQKADRLTNLYRVRFSSNPNNARKRMMGSIAK